MFRAREGKQQSLCLFWLLPENGFIPIHNASKLTPPPKKREKKQMCPLWWCASFQFQESRMPWNIVLLIVSLMELAVQLFYQQEAECSLCPDQSSVKGLSQQPVIMCYPFFTWLLWFSVKERMRWSGHLRRQEFLFSLCNSIWTWWECFFRIPLFWQIMCKCYIKQRQVEVVKRRKVCGTLKRK